jgi:hypothetical protein
MLEQNTLVYPEPYLSRAEHEAVQKEIRRDGFTADPLLAHLDAPFLGLNVAFGWPLPAAFRAAYEVLQARLAALDPAAYLYPYAETHVTVATVVNFKQHPDPSPEERRRLREVIPTVAIALDRACAGIAPFPIDVGPPVLVRPAAFLPILNPGAEVRRIREALAAALRGAGPALAELRLPTAVHSTVLRFHRPPPDPAAFTARFLEIAQDVHFGPATVEELLVTTETKAYMLEGEIVARTRLK